MKFFAFGLVLGTLFGLAVVVRAAPAPRAEQPHTDTFMYNGQSLALYNPLDVVVKVKREVRYRFLTMPGCYAGTIPADLEALVAPEFQKVGLSLVRDDVSYDLTIRANCGSEQIRLCGAVTVFCLGRGFPGNDDVELSDILSTYSLGSRLSIPLHELLHATATFNEQYCLGGETAGPCRGLPQFTPAPNWPDVMNTGVASRHGLEAIELERWSRVMYDVLPPPEPEPVPEWGACEQYADGSWGCWNNWGSYWQRTIWNPATYRWSPSDPVWRCVEACP